MIWLVKLYPAKWRERYGEEFAEILARQRPSIGMIMDVLGGALDAHLHPQIHVQQLTLEGDTMTDSMMQRCAAGGPALSKREQLTAGIGMLVGSLALTIIYVILRKIYHDIPAVEGFGYTILPAMLLFYAQMAYLRRRTFGAQVFLVGGMLGFLYLIMWGACLIAAGFDTAGRHYH